MDDILHDIGDINLNKIIGTVAFGKSDEFKKLRSQFYRYDRDFLFLLAYSHPDNQRKRIYINKAYKKFKSILDTQYVTEFPMNNRFISRLWEIVLCDLLLGSGQISIRTSEGPDFLLESLNGERIGVEAVAPDESKERRITRATSSCPNIQSSAGGNIEEHEIPVILRTLNQGLREKLENKKYKKDKPLIIAINARRYAGIASQDEYVLRRLLFGLGYHTITRDNYGSYSKGLQVNNNLLLQNKELKLGLFDKEEYKHISGIIYTSRHPLDLLGSGYGWSKEAVIYVPNPNTIYPLKTEFPFFKRINSDGKTYYLEYPAERDFISSVE